MIQVIKLTAPDRTFYTGVKWRVGQTNRVVWGGHMCENGCLHGYKTLGMAVMASPGHVHNYTRALICSTPEILASDGLKIGMAEMTGVRWVKLPKVTLDQRVEWAVRCVLLMPKVPKKFKTWAAAWLDGSDRNAGSAGDLIDGYWYHHEELAFALSAVTCYHNHTLLAQYAVDSVGAMLRLYPHLENKVMEITCEIVNRKG